jgi:hypothetical protein
MGIETPVLITMTTPSQPDGGAAFPQPMAAMPDGEMYCASEKSPEFAGMSLRDWFAGQCLSGLISQSVLGIEERLAEMAYKQADAMLAEREKGKG